MIVYPMPNNVFIERPGYMGSVGNIALAYPIESRETKILAVGKALVGRLKVGDTVFLSERWNIAATELDFGAIRLYSLHSDFILGVISDECGV